MAYWVLKLVLTPILRFFWRVRVEGIEALERVIEQLRRDQKVMRTRTMVALSTLVERP